jgi:hypothetical protein
VLTDNVILWAQAVVDRLSRRFRSAPSQDIPRRRLLVVQIDGLPRAVLEHARASGHVPFLDRLLRQHSYELGPMFVGLPTSTPAFQLAAMYGVRPDIPGFHYHDKRRKRDVHFPEAGDADVVEQEQSRGRLGILDGGSVYGCVFTGGADNDTLSFARLKQPTGPGLARFGSAFVVLGWVLAKCTVLTLREIVSTLVDLGRHPRERQKVWQWAAIRIGFSVWIRELFTLAVSRDLYAAVPAIYVNYLDYDVAGHAFGPRSPRAYRSLERIDRAIHQIWRVVRRLPEHQYDLFILSDHGQIPCHQYGRLSGGIPLERALFADGVVPTHSQPGAVTSRRPPLGHGFRAYRVGRRRGLSRIMRPLEGRIDHELDTAGDTREACERDGVRIISAGPNAFIYLTDTPGAVAIEELDRRFPGLAEEISRQRGVGFVLARSGAGPICCWRGKRIALNRDGGPFSERPDRDAVLRSLADLMAMPSAGDLVIYGTGAIEGDVSYIAEAGAHAGPAEEELHTFIVHPARVQLPRIEHPIQLYDVFIRYQGTPRSKNPRPRLSEGSPTPS